MGLELKQYKEKGYILRKRAIFLFYLIAATIALSIVALISTFYIQASSVVYEKIHIAALLPILGVTFISGFCLRLLVKGQYQFAANLFTIAISVAVWLVIFLDKGKGFSKINTIVFVFGVLAMLPLLINSRKRILLYGVSNVLIFLVFIFVLHLNIERYNIDAFEFLDSLFDISFMLIFVTVVHFNVSSINSIALKNAEEEIDKRKKVAIELKYHKDNLEKLVEEKTKDQNELNEELKATNDVLYQKNDEINIQNIKLNDALKHLKETQMQLLQAEKLASLGTLTAGVAHEINNPLNYLMGAYVGLTNYFKENGSNDEENISILLNSIKVGVDRASYIVKGLGQFSRDNDQFDEDCNIHSIMDNCLMMLRSQLKHKVEVKKEYHNQPLIVNGNVGKLHQVFVNILSNANQAIRDRGEIEIITNQENEHVLIEISDNGCGIKQEDVQQVTDPFFTTKAPGEGVGLGLSITYSIIKEHNGELKIQSELERGTKVVILLPCK